MGEAEAGQEPIRVVVVDDHPMVRMGLSAMLRTAEDIALVGVAADGEEALRVCAETCPDVVLMDLQLPRLDGITAIQALRHQDPAPQVLALTSYSEEHLVREALQAGAIGYLAKDITAEQLAAAIRGARMGRPTLSPSATEALVRAAAAPAGVPALAAVSLTKREKEVLALVVDGRRNKEIASRLVVSTAAVKFHIQHLFFKLGVSSRAELVAVALQRHLLD